MNLHYPIFERLSATEYVSQEQVDGTPDYRIVCHRATKLWHVSARVSQHWSGQTYRSLKEAITAIRQGANA